MHGTSIELNGNSYVAFYGALAHQHVGEVSATDKDALIDTTMKLCFYSLYYGQKVNKLPFELSFEDFMVECSVDPEGYEKLIKEVQKQFENSPLFQPQSKTAKKAKRNSKPVTS